MTSNDTARPIAAPVDGLLLLNKPAGITSNQALQKVKRLLQAKKAGHTGSLDPAATGMLPLCFGEATKVCAYLLEADKTYRVTARLGEATNTGDRDGEISATAEVPDLDRSAWEQILAQFCGEIDQVPPMFSALKKDGKRLYELARKGQVVEREARRIRIDEISLLEISGTRLVLRVKCSKGTYIRTLVEDIARAAGTVAHTARLHRRSARRRTRGRGRTGCTTRAAAADRSGLVFMAGLPHPGGCGRAVLRRSGGSGGQRWGRRAGRALSRRWSAAQRQPPGAATNIQDGGLISMESPGQEPANGSGKKSLIFWYFRLLLDRN